MEESKNVLRPEVAAKYTCTIEPKPVTLRPPIGDYRLDLRDMDLAQADELYNKGFELLVLKEAPADLSGSETDQQTTKKKGK